MFPVVRTLVRRAAAPALVSALALLAACESESDPVGPGSTDEVQVGETVVTTSINATSSDTLVYFSLATNSVVPRTGDWDIALRRYEIRLNSSATAGTATKNVTAASLGNNLALSNTQLLALTTDNTLAAFNAVSASAITSATFTGDVLSENKSGYLNFSGLPTANAAAYWKVRTANNGFALVHVTGITYGTANNLASMTIESRLQSGTTLGAAQTTTVPLNGTTPVNVSLVTNAVVTPSGCNWDLLVDPRLSQSFAITTNTGCNVGTYPGGSSPTFANATSASDAPTYALYLAALSGPIPNDVTSTSATLPLLFKYNLNNDNRLTPTFNTFLVKSGTKVYKLQSINYYSAAGASGNVTLRYARLQ